MQEPREPEGDDSEFSVSTGGTPGLERTKKEILPKLDADREKKPPPRPRRKRRAKKRRAKKTAPRRGSKPKALDYKVSKTSIEVFDRTYYSPYRKIYEALPKMKPGEMMEITGDDAQHVNRITVAMRSRTSKLTGTWSVASRGKIILVERKK